MPVVYQKRVSREELQANPRALYLFGDNDLREGYGGQAAEMRDEDNALGVRTMWAEGVQRQDYFHDRDLVRVTQMIDQDLEKAREHLEDGGVVIIPLDGLGSGLPKLPEKAPQVFEMLEEKIKELEGIDE